MSQSTPTLTIEPFQPADAPAVHDVIRSVWREFGGTDEPTDEPDLASIATAYSHGASGFWVARSGPRVVGCVALKDIGSGIAALKRMYVLTNFRGATTGTGALLLDALLHSARRHSLEALFLGTPDFLHRAHRFYQKHNFHPVERHHLPPTFPLGPIDTLFFRRHLT